MKYSLKIIALFLSVLIITAWSPIDKIGGDFAGKPDAMETHISAGAKDLIEKSFADVKADDLHDHHVHIVGLDKDKGTTVNARLLDWWHIIDRVKTSVYLSGAAITDIAKANEEYIERLVSLIKADKHHGKYHILAFDHNYNDDGTINDAKSEFYTSNEYVMNLAKQYPDIFVPVISVHPYRKDAIAELTKFAKQGARWIKWLPNAHNIDASSPRLDEYYRTMKKYNMVLLTHAGEEKAVEAEEDQRFGNPLLFRRPLDMGVKVVMAHCASLGEDEDLDNPGQRVPSFDLFMRLMDNPKYNGLLFGEISAMTQFNRLPVPMLKLLERTDLHSRLINGSDYPLPAINVVIQMRSLIKQGMITESEGDYLTEIYSYNPLIFDYVLKRTIRHPQTGKGFSAEVFKTIVAR
jgi:predicted TIM-barrel fold metal-dependent hydrolase